MNILNSVKNFFKTPFRTIMSRNMSFFSFYNRDLATNETIFAAVSMLSKAIASAPITVQKDCIKLKSKEHNLARLIEYGPNPQMTMFDFIKSMEVQRNTKGAAYAIKEYGYGGEITGIWILNSDYVEPKVEEETKELYYEISIMGKSDFVHNSHIIAVTYLTTDGYTPISPLDVLRNTIDYDREIKEFSLNQMQNGLKSNIVVKLQTKLDENGLKLYNDMLSKFQKNGILYVDQGKEFQELKNTSFIDPNVAAVESITVERVERVYSMPGKLTGKANDVEDLLYLKDTILPTARMYEQEFSKKCLPESERDEGIKVKLSLNGFARADMKTRGDFYFKGVRSSWFSANDIRALEDMPSIPGGDVYYVSRDLVPIDKIDLILKKSKN